MVCCRLFLSAKTLKNISILSAPPARGRLGIVSFSLMAYAQIRPHDGDDFGMNMAKGIERLNALKVAKAAKRGKRVRLSDGNNL